MGNKLTLIRAEFPIDHLRYACHPQALQTGKMAVFCQKTAENDGFFVFSAQSITQVTLC
jgi:hypothetical protein